MNKKIKYITGTAILLASLLMLSCKGMFSQKIEEPSSKDGKTYLTLKVNNSRQAYRTLASDKNLTFDITQFTDFSLIGKYESEEAKSLFEATSYSDLPQKIEIMSGQWVFNLYAKYKGIQFTDAEKSQYIMKGRENSISFTLKPVEEFGGCDISFTLTDSQVSKVEVTLKSSSDGKIILDKSPLQISENNGAKTVSLKRNMASESERLSSGRYYAKFDFYTGEDGSKGYALLNEYESYLIITAAFTTSANITLDFNELYTITYKYITDSGEAVELVDAENFALASNSFVPFYYSKGSEITLPEAKQNKKIFLGWKNSDGQSIEKIEKGSSGNLVLTADFMDPILYVSGTGDDTSGDGSQSNPFESIDKACEKIIELGNPDINWTIYIMGDVTGPHTSNNKAGSRGEKPSTAGDTDFGRTELSADITSDYAKSILLIGKTGLDTNGYPQDMLNRGLVQNSSTAYKDTGNVIAIATTVPVTIKNLKITGGNTASSSSTNTTNDPYYRNGGGLYVAEGANVTLDDGVLITKNKAYNGGAVYNAGTLTMVGTATIGDSSVTTYPQAGITDLTNPASNEYKYGGGIYNTGTLYLGIEGKNLTGGIYNSYGGSAYGGGIYNTGTGSVVMSSGKINYNDGQSYGGGVYLNSGTFKMTGGEIFYNSTGDQGGGVYVNSGAVFYFGGGTISGNNANTYGGGVYIQGESSGSGKMFMYGDAVIGKSSATSQAPEIPAGYTQQEKVAMNDGCNIAVYGAGIYAQGELYMGYSDQDVTDPLTGGIYYNTAKKNVNYGYSNGGGLYVSGSYAKVYMNSGTINYNYAKEGPGIDIVSNYFTMTSLTKGADTYVPIILQGIGISEYYYSINIDSLLASAATGAYNLVPPKNNDETGYSSNVSLIKPTAAATAQNITINDIKDKFTVEPFTNPKTGISTNWIINSSGKPVQKAETINVSSSGTCTSISDAAAQMNDSTKDYIISISGIITGPQTISSTVQANSITIKGATTTDATNVPNNGIDASLGNGVAGTALTIDTSVPVTLNNICVKGGHGTEKDGVIIGGGLLLGQNAHVCLDNNTRILQNITYDKGDGTPGYGAGVYISNKAKLYENKDCHITENTATSKGAGIYIAAGGCLQTMAGSGSYVTLNTFDTNFKDSNNQSITPCGGAVYIEDNATLEMFGAWYRDNCQNVDNCLGSGIYLSANGNLKIKGHTEVILPNVIYMASSAKIEIADSLSPYDPGSSSGRLTARLMLESYTEGSEILQAGTGVTTYTFGSATAKFEIIPQEITGGQKQYWALNNSGQLEKKAGTQLTVSIPTNENDIQVSIQRIVGGEVQTLEPGTHFTGGNKLTFTATDGFDSYKWTIDGEEETDNNAMTIDTTNWTVGNYVIYLEAKDSAGKYYSYTAQINVGNI